MFQVIHFRHRWCSSTEVESEVVYNGEVIVVSVVNVDKSTIRLISGGFDSLEENPRNQVRDGETHVQYWTDVVKEHTAGWAMSNSQM